MPFTFAHPAAILPASKTGNRLSQTGLIVGSMVPDLEFFFKLRLDENIGHKLHGILLFDIPVGILVAVLFHLFIKSPLIHSLPSFIQRRISPFLNPGVLDSMKKNWGWFLFSLIFGIFTHLGLDSMTHFDGWIVLAFESLQNSITLAGKTFPLYEGLQYGFSVVGLVWLGVAFWRMPKGKAIPSESKETLKFWALAFGLSILWIGLRIQFYPEFSSFWDGFVMVVGSFFYATAMIGLFEFYRTENSSGSDGQFDELINAGSIDPSFKIGAFSVEQDQLPMMLGERVMHVDHFVDKAQVVVADSSDIEVNDFKRFSEQPVEFCSQKFTASALSLPAEFDFTSGFALSLNRKFLGSYIHVVSQFREVIKSLWKLVAFLSIIFLVSVQVKAQETMSAEVREQWIQKATALRAEEKFLDAIACLDSILVSNPVDAPILLFKGDLSLQAKDFGQAVSTYKALLPLDYEATITRINLSYALFMGRNPGKALNAAYEAWAQDSLHKGAVVNYFNAMLWNIKTKEAGKFLEENKGLVDRDQYLVMQARLWTTSGNYKTGLIYYDSLVNAFPKPYYIQEFTEVLIGKKRWEKAEAILENLGDSLSASQRQKIEGMLAEADTHTAGVQLGFFEDIGGNRRLEQAIFWRNEQKSRLQAGIRAGSNQVTSPEDQFTRSNFLAATLGYRWSPAVESQGELVAQQVSPDTGDSYSGLTGKFETRYQPNDRRMFGVFYSSELLNFTADLLGKNIRSQNLGYVTHIMLDGKTGIFSQGSYGTINDGNSRQQFFGSIYRVLRTEPTLKTGLNFSALRFSDSETTLYFAPERFLSTELFVDYSTPMPLVAKMVAKFQGAAGLQKIEELDWEPTFRAQLELVYRLSGFDLGLTGQFSNVASASGTGYRFHYVTLNIQKKF
ncbi:DUF4184 family protein [Algoriphagus mannitolivorans]|uniref:DUF4184 family protein n=1 Tax=Algoriphagus mannitolivorans TaxID=226504 RepID=UPI00047BCF74|nr:DUF4184 family protein [Algoriphagus mannitolivorans]